MKPIKINLEITEKTLIYVLAVIGTVCVTVLTILYGGSPANLQGNLFNESGEKTATEQVEDPRIAKCTAAGGQYQKVQDDQGESEYCKFPNNVTCDLRRFLEGKCKPEREAADQPKTMKLAAKNTADGIEVSWDEVEHATSYKLERAYDKNDLQVAASGTEREFLDEKVSAGEKYRYRVHALTEEEVVATSEIVTLQYNQPVAKTTAPKKSKTGAKQTTPAAIRNEVPAGKLGVVSAEAITPQLLRVQLSRPAKLPTDPELLAELVQVNGERPTRVLADTSDDTQKTLLVFAENLSEENNLVQLSDSLRDNLGEQILTEFTQVKTEPAALVKVRRQADMNQDEKIDFDDFTMFAEKYGTKAG